MVVLTSDGGSAATVDRGTRRWLWWLALVALVGLAIRLTYIHVHTQNVSPFSDAFYYHSGANLLADGHGFVDPIAFAVLKRSLPGAGHPPGFIVVLAAASLLGFKSFFAHQVAAALLSTATVVVVGLVGRHLAGPRTGLIAAGAAAVYPNFFFSDALLLSETIVLFMGAVTLLMTYRFWEHPTLRRAAGLGFAVGLTALARSETVLLLILLLVPAAMLLCQLDTRRRLALLAAAGTAAVLTMAPWVAYNLVRFEHPVFLSIPDATLLAGNCAETYYGKNVGYWSIACITRVGTGHGPTEAARLIDQLRTQPGDASTAGLAYRRSALHYIRRHLRRTPFVVFAREGRTFGFYQPSQQLGLDQLAPRELRLSRVAQKMYYVLLVAAIAGAVIMRRRHVALFPLLALVASVVLAVAATIGETRYRALAEVPLVLCAAVGIDALLSRLGAVPKRNVSPGG